MDLTISVNSFLFLPRQDEMPENRKRKKSREIETRKSENYRHRRRMETEGKAKVVASVWWAKFVQFFAALAVLPRSIWKKRFNSSSLFGRNGLIRTFLSNRETTASAARNLTNFAPQTDATTFALNSVSILLL